MNIRNWIKRLFRIVEEPKPYPSMNALRFRAYRRSRGITQRDAAKLTGIAFNRLSRWERGEIFIEGKDAERAQLFLSGKWEQIEPEELPANTEAVIVELRDEIQVPPRDVK